MSDRLQLYRTHDAPYTLPLGLPIEMSLDVEQGSVISSPTPSEDESQPVDTVDIELLPIKIPTLPRRLPGRKNKDLLHKEIKDYNKYTKYTSDSEPARCKSNFKSLSKLTRQESSQSNYENNPCVRSINSISSRGSVYKDPNKWTHFELETNREQKSSREKTTRDIEESGRRREFDFDLVKKGLEKSKGGRVSVTSKERYSNASDITQDEMNDEYDVNNNMNHQYDVNNVNHEYDRLPEDLVNRPEEQSKADSPLLQGQDKSENEVGKEDAESFLRRVNARDAARDCTKIEKNYVCISGSEEEEQEEEEEGEEEEEDDDSSDDEDWSDDGRYETEDEQQTRCDDPPKSPRTISPTPPATPPMPVKQATRLVLPKDVPQTPSVAPPPAPPAPPPMSVDEIRRKTAKEKEKLRGMKSDPLKLNKKKIGRDKIAKQANSLLLDRMFKMITKGDYDEIKAFLYCHAAEVEVIPKVGCDPAYYDGTKNIANMSDPFGNTPLLIACKTRDDIAMLLLRFGADPNHVDKQSIAALGEYPLECAAKAHWRRDNYFNMGHSSRAQHKLKVFNKTGLMEQLVLHGADLCKAVHNLCKKLVQPNMESFDSMMELCALVNPGLMMLTEEPIETAHVCSVILRDTGIVKDEYHSDCMKLAAEADKFALSYLDSCHKLWEARRLLGKKSILENALRQRKKSFVAHPFCQELLLEEWYGGLEYRSTSRLLGLLFTYFFGSLLIPFYTLDMLNKGRYHYTRLEDLLKKMMTPYLCFVADALNFLILLVLLILVCVSLDQDGDLTNPTILEIVMWLCLLTRFMIEFNQWCFNKRYFTNFWNFVDMILIVCLAIAIVYRLVACYCLSHWSTDWQKRHALNVIYIYSCAEIVLFLRLLNMLDITYALGPLQLAVKRMLGDVVKLVVLLSIVVVAFSISISALMSYAVQKAGHAEDERVKGFTSIVASCLTLFWSLFDLADVDALTIEGDKPSTFLTKLLFGLYLIIAVVIMLNMLIAMLNNTYQSIWTNQDLEWKFSRAKLFKEYRKGIPFIFPFLLIIYPIIMGYRWNNRKHKKEVLQTKFNIHRESMKAETDAGRQLSVDSESKNDEKLMRYKLLGMLSQRYADKHDLGQEIYQS